MSYRERLPPTIDIGCLPAAVFGVLTGTPAAFLIVMAECEDANGLVASCPQERLELLFVALVIAGGCLLITWATNRMVGSLTQRGLGAAWGVCAGFALAAALCVALIVAWLAIV